VRILVTGSLGLVGSEVTKFYLDQGHKVVGIDNNSRKKFFGEDGDVSKNRIPHKNYTHFNLDIRDVGEVLDKYLYDVVIHAAAQPSHDWSAKYPLLDFHVNALGTLNLLELCRILTKDVVFVYISTNKVYGDAPNDMTLTEYRTRYDCDSSGVNEMMSLDQSTHSPFGVSKLAGDLYVQEYARYYGMRTGVFRCGCITGSRHSGAELHGFLSYMVRCKKEKRHYKIYGYKGKQVRDNIHAYDLVTAIDEFVRDPRPGEVYNMGGGRNSNISVLEAINKLQLPYEYIDEPRKGDHKWYISDVSKFKNHFPHWEYKYDMETIFENLVSA
jgi:CDP-paratose 2-epimerase